MALNLDPITGLPSDFLAPDLYQIPLNSRPQLAPEWSPDHLPPNALHPDNMPSMFATVQAQNSLNPELPQALTTDGKGNLNVNAISAGGGGGGTSYGATGSVSEWETASSFTSDQRCILNGRVKTLWRLFYSAGLDRSSCNVGQPIVMQIKLVGDPSGNLAFFDTMAFIQNPAGVSLNTVDVQSREILFPGGWANPFFMDPADTSLWVHFLAQNGGFFPIVCASMDYS